MNFTGIQFAPVNIPLHRRLETLSAFTVTFLSTYLGLLGIVLSTYFLLCPLFWPIFIPYLIWIVIDRNTPHRGGRSINWVRSWPIFKHASNYYPISVKMDLKLDPKRNYLFCYFPHGTITQGPLIAFLPKEFDGKVLFPDHKSLGITLNGSFMIPFYREFILSIGFCSANAESMNWILGDPNGGNVLGLVVGGASESFHSDEKGYRIVLRNRKGFVKLALKNGAPLVPCFSFGETKLFKQISFSNGTSVRRVQEWIQKKLGAAPIFIHGRGFFQYTFGCVPFRNPINIVVGDPIEIPKIENPTKEEIDLFHKKFITGLCDIFEKYKYEYERDPENCSLIIS